MSQFIFPGKLWKGVWPSKQVNADCGRSFLKVAQLYPRTTKRQGTMMCDIVECLNTEYEDKGLGAKNEEAHPNPCRRGKQNCNR